MVKVGGPLHSQDARGSLGDGITFQGFQRGVRVERRPRHRDAGSAAQLTHRGVFLDAVVYWHGLSAVAKAEYNERGDPLNLTGYNLCLREYLRGLVEVGLSLRPTRNESPSRFFPEAGAAIVITPPADASWSDYAVLVADSGAECVLSTVNVECVHNVSPGGAGGRSMFLELNVGADGFEVPIGTWSDSCTLTTVNLRYLRQFRLACKLPANSRLTARVRLSASAANPYFTMAVAVVAPPTPVLFASGWDENAYRQGGGSVSALVPAAPSFAAVVCGVADGWGDPVELVEEAAGRELVVGVDVRSVSGGAPPYPSRVAVQIGVGGPGDEKWHEATELVSSATVIQGAVEFPRSVEVVTGERVVGRAQSNVAGKNVNLALMVEGLNF